jgi:hypothetical protein
LADVDTTQFGQPLIASKQLLNLKYSTVPAFQKDLLLDHKFWMSRVDYKDEILPFNLLTTTTTFWCTMMISVGITIKLELPISHSADF